MSMPSLFEGSKALAPSSVRKRFLGMRLLTSRIGEHLRLVRIFSLVLLTRITDNPPWYPILNS